MKENKEKISVAAVQYATVESLNQEARIRTSADNKLRETIEILSNDYEEFKASGGNGVSKDYVDTQDALKQNINDTNLNTTSKTIVGAINENVTTINTKQNTLVDTGENQNIKTINSQSLLGSGNIDITSSGSTELDNNIEIYDNESNNFVQYKMDLDWNKASNNSLTSKSYINQQDTTITNLVNLKADKSYVDEQDNLKANTTYVDSQDALKQNINDTNLNTTSKTIVEAINENQTSINSKQDKTDQTLNTEDKTIVGGINELLTSINTKQNTLVDSGENQNIKTINSQSILGTGNIDISRESTSLDNNIEIFDNESNNFVQYKASDLDWSKASDNSLTSKNYVDTQDTIITNSINLKADKSYVDEQDSLKADTTYVNSQDALKQNINDTNLNTTNKTIVEAINENLTSINNKQNILVDTGNNQNIKTINDNSLLGTGNIEINTPLDNNIEIYDNESNNFVQYKASDLDWSKASDNSLTSKNYVDTQDSTITNSINLKADKSYVDEQDSLKADTTYVNSQDALKQNINDTNLNTTSKTIVGAINENVTTINSKQNTLIDTGENQNIKTINSQSLLGSGNINISTESTPLDNNIEIYNNESNNFVQYKTSDLDWSKASDNSLTSKSYIDQQDTTITTSVNLKADTTYVDSQDALKQNINDTNLNTTSKTIVEAINENLTSINNKQNILVDTGNNQNIKTINDNSLLGTGNIEINTPLDNNIEIYDNESNNFIQYKMNLNWSKASDNSLTSKNYVDTQDTIITNSINLKADKSYVDEQDSLKADTTYVNSQDNLKQNINDTNLTTTDKTIVGAINELIVTKTSYTYVDSQVSVKQNQNDSTLNTEDKTVVGGINELLTSINTKQNTLVDTGENQNIKTINNQSLLGSGNIEISTPLDNNIETYDNESNNFVQYKMNLDWSKASDNSLTSKNYVDTQDSTITTSVNLKADKTYVDSQDVLFRTSAINTSLNNTNRAIYDIYWGNLDTNDKTITGSINEVFNTKQNILVDSGDNQNIKTINGKSLLGTGNIDICNDEVQPEPVAGWKNIDSNTFTKITGVTGKISSIDLTITSSTVSAFFAGSTAGRIYKSTNQQAFVVITTSGIVTAGQTFSNLILDNQGYLYVAFKDIHGNLGGVYRTGSSTSTALARYYADPLIQPIMGLFLNKATNDSYAAMENTQLEITRLYKWNSTPTATTPTILLNTPLITGSCAGFTLDTAGNIYFVINNINNGRASVFKYDVANSSAPELILTLADTTIRSIATNNNVIYLAAENINTNTSIIYQSIDLQKFIKSGIKTDWTINQIIFDDQNHLYAGGINSNLYAAVINNNSIDNFSIISSQTFNNIYSLNYEQNVLIVGGQDEFSLAQVNNFDFTENS